MQPRLSIRVVDDEDQQDLDGRILTFVFSDDEKKAAQCKVTVDNPERRFHDSPIWRFGTVFEVAWSAGGLTSSARRMILPKGGIKGNWSRFSVTLNEVGVVMGIEPRGSRRFDDVTHSEVVDKIAEENGFGAEFRRITETQTRYESVTRRADETDGAFLARLARLQRDYVFWIDHRGLHWGPRRLDQSPVARLGLGDLIDDVNIDEIKPDRPARMTVAARDRAAKRALRETIENALDPARPGLGAVLALGKSASGTADALGVDTASFLAAGKLLVSGASVKERVDPETGQITSVIVSGDAPEDRVGGTKVERSARPGDDQARSGYREAQIGAVALSAKFRGNPYLLAKTVVELDLGDKRLSGRYWVRSSVHNLSDGSNGYTTRLKLISDGHGGHSTVGSTTFDLGRAGGGRTGRAQDFDAAARQVQSLLILVTSSAALNSDFQAVSVSLARDLDRLRARRPGSVSRARRTVRRTRQVAAQANVPVVVQSASYTEQRLREVARGETVSTAAQPTSRVSDGELVAVERVDPERGTVIQYRERSGD